MPKPDAVVVHVFALQEGATAHYREQITFRTLPGVDVRRHTWDCWNTLVQKHQSDPQLLYCELTAWLNDERKLWQTTFVRYAEGVEDG